MTYHILFLLITLLLLVKLTSNKANKDVNPLFLFFSTWGISLLMYIIGKYFDSIHNLYVLIGIDILSYRTTIFLITTNILIYLGSILLRKVKIRKTHYDISHISYKANLLYSLTIYLAITFFILELFLNYRNYISLSLLYELRTQDKNEGSIFALITTYLSILVLPISIWQINIGNTRFLNWIPILVILILAFINLSKYLIIFIFIFWVTNIVLGNNSLYKNKFEIKSILTKSIVIVLILGSIITILRPSHKNTNSQTISFVPIFFTYSSGYIPSFSNFYEEYISHVAPTTAPSYEYYDKVKNRFGNQTFAGFYRLLQQLKITKYGATVHYEGLFNVYTFYRDLITDFGIQFTYLICFLIGLFSTILDKSLDRNNPRHLTYITIIATIFIFTLTYSLFGFTFIFLMLLTPYIYIKKIKYND